MTFDSSPSSAPLTRRSFLGTTSTIVGALAISQLVPRPLLAQLGRTNDPAPGITDPRIKPFVFRGVQAAKDAGANFAEVRLSHTLRRTIDTRQFTDVHTLHASVQAYVDGVWGFASSAVWSDDDIVQLAQRAVQQARDTAGIVRASTTIGGNTSGAPLSLSARPDGPRTGHWVTPIQQDPFAIHPNELQDWLDGLSTQLPRDYAKQSTESVAVMLSAICTVQERAYGASDDTFVTQRLYRTSGDVTARMLEQTDKGARRGSGRVPIGTPAGVGWELFTIDRLRDATFATFDRLHTERVFKPFPTVVGRYPVVFDAYSTSVLLSHTLGRATELDHALGYGPYGDGPGWLGQPATMLGQLKVGSPLLTVTANRSEPEGAATVQWDDEGVVPQTTTLVENGVFKQYQQTRAGAAQLAHAGSSAASPSTGVAYAPTAGSAPTARCANLVMAGAPNGGTYEELLQQVGKGVVFEEISIVMDSTQRTGTVTGRVYELINGKKASFLVNAGVLLDAAALWQALSALGGSASAFRQSFAANRGGVNPEIAYHSVTAVPAVFTSLPIFDRSAR